MLFVLFDLDAAAVAMNSLLVRGWPASNSRTPEQRITADFNISRVFFCVSCFFRLAIARQVSFSRSVAAASGGGGGGGASRGEAEAQ